MPYADCTAAEQSIALSGLTGEDTPYYTPLAYEWTPVSKQVSDYACWLRTGQFSKIVEVLQTKCVCAEQAAFWAATVLSAAGHPATVLPAIVHDIDRHFTDEDRRTMDMCPRTYYNFRVKSDLPFMVDVASGEVFMHNSTGCEFALVNERTCVYTPYEYEPQSGFWDVMRIYYHDDSDMDGLYLLKSLLFAAENPHLLSEKWSISDD